MAFSEELRDRILAALEPLPISHKKMFGGLGVFYQGNMFAGVSGDRLMVKIGPTAASEVCAGRELFHGMKQWLLLDEPADLAEWLGRGLETVSKSPPKS